MANGSDYAGRVAVITGGASGIGLALARALAGRGAALVLADIEQAPLDQAVSALADAGAAVIGVRTDVGDLASMQALADRAWERFGKVHFVANNAGVAVFGPTQAMTHQDWLWSVQVNLWGPIHGAEVFTQRMIDQGEGGHLLFTASFAGLVPNRELGPYNVTKAAVVALAESLHKDLRQTGIGVSVLCPMRVASNIDQSRRNRPGALGVSAGAYSQEDLANLVGRTLTAEAVAELTLTAVGRGQLYIHTHVEAEAPFRARAERIAAAFASAL